MFDIGFTELLLISIVALLVLGPDKLPQAVRVTALWVGRARRSFNKVKSEIEEQLNADEIRRELHNESIMADLDEAKKKARKLGEDTRHSFQKLDDDVKNTIHDGALRDGIMRKGNKARRSEDEAESSDTDSKDSGKDSRPADEPGTGEDSAGDRESGDAGNEEQESEKQEPVTDFYNNPGGRIVSLKGGNFATAEHPDETRDQENGGQEQQDSESPRKGEQTGSRHNDKEG